MKRGLSRAKSRGFTPSLSRGFTLIEILVVFAILMVLILMGWFSWKNQINKARDAQRKDHLKSLSIAFEDYYNDNDCYPIPGLEKVCYDSPIIQADGTLTCHICGSQSTSPDFSPYLPNLPCDPDQPLKEYFYQVDNNSCPTWYRIYDILANTNDLVIAEINCHYGCGPSPDFTYNYGVSSTNIDLETNNNLCSLASSLYVNPSCSDCGDYDKCQANHSGKIYYTDPGTCLTPCIKD
ncbi:MAG: prepilin-type N-terminal cleavage/methylation domain-containing protein [Candidatus Beckwithbacteria bacterium]